MMQVSSSTNMEEQDGGTGTVVKRLSVPVGLEELMASLTKEVLQKKPRDIYNFASEHFAHLLALRDNGNYQQPPSKAITYASKENIENILGRQETLSGKSGKHLSRQVSIRADSPTRKSGQRRIKRSGTPKHDGNNNNSDKETESEKKKKTFTRKQTPGSKNKFDSLEVVKEDSLKLATKRHSLSRKATDSKSSSSKSDSQSSKESKSSVEENGKTKKKKKKPCPTASPGKFVPKKSSVEEGKAEIKDGLLTVSSPKILKDSQKSPESFNLSTTLVVPVVAAATSCLKEGDTANDKQKEPHEDSETGEATSKSYDSLILRQELQKAEDEAKFNNFKSSYNPYILKQEIKNASETLENNNETVKDEDRAQEKLNSKIHEHEQDTVSEGSIENKKEVDDNVKMSKTDLASTSQLQHSSELHDILIPKEPSTGPRIENPRSPNVAEVEQRPLSTKLQHTGEMHDTLVPKEIAENVIVSASHEGLNTKLQHSGELHDTLVPKEIAENVIVPASHDDKQEAHAKSKKDEISISQRVADAATTIQAGIRGYLTRKQYKNETSQRTNENGKGKEIKDEELEEMAKRLDSIDVPSESPHTSVMLNLENEDSLKDEKQDHMVKEKLTKSKSVHEMSPMEKLQVTGFSKSLSVTDSAISKTLDDDDEKMRTEEYESFEHTEDLGLGSEISTTQYLEKSSKSFDESKEDQSEKPEEDKEKESHLEHTGEIHDSLIPKERINEEHKTWKKSPQPPDTGETLHEEKVSKDDVSILQEASTRDTSLQHSGELHDTLVLKEAKETVSQSKEDSSGNKLEEAKEKDDEIKVGQNMKVQDENINVKETKEEEKEEVRQKEIPEVEEIDSKGKVILQHSSELHDLLIPKLVEEKALGKSSDLEKSKYIGQLSTTETENVHDKNHHDLTNQVRKEDNKLDEGEKLEHSGEFHDILIPKDTREILSEIAKNKTTEESKNLEHSSEFHDTLIPKSEDLKPVKHSESVEILHEKSLDKEVVTSQKGKDLPDTLTLNETVGLAEDIQRPNSVEDKHLKMQDNMDRIEETLDKKETTPLLNQLDSVVHDSDLESKEEELDENIKDAENLQHTGELHDTVIPKEIPLASRDDAQDIPKVSDNKTEELPAQILSVLPDEEEQLKKDEEIVKGTNDAKQLTADNLQHTGELHDLLIPKRTSSASKKDEDVHTEEQVEEIVPSAQLKGNLEEIRKLSEEKRNIEHTSSERLEHTGELHDTLVPENRKHSEETMDNKDDKKRKPSAELKDTIDNEDASVKEVQELITEAKSIEQLERGIYKEAPERDIDHSKKTLDDESDQGNISPSQSDDARYKDVEKNIEGNTDENNHAEQLEEEKLKHTGELHDTIVVVDKKTPEETIDIKEDKTNKLSTELEDTIDNKDASIKDSEEPITEIKIPVDESYSASDISMLHSEVKQAAETPLYETVTEKQEVSNDKTPSTSDISKLHSEVESLTKASSPEETLGNNNEVQDATSGEIPSTFDVSKLHADVENATRDSPENKPEKNEEEHQVPVNEAHNTLDITELGSEVKKASDISLDEKPQKATEKQTVSIDEVPSTFDISKLHDEVESTTKTPLPEQRSEKDLQAQHATPGEIPNTFDISTLLAAIENSIADSSEDKSEKSEKERQVPVSEAHSTFDISQLHSEVKKAAEAPLDEQSQDVTEKHVSNDKVPSTFDISKLHSEVESTTKDFSPEDFQVENARADSPEDKAEKDEKEEVPINEGNSGFDLTKLRSEIKKAADAPLDEKYQAVTKKQQVSDDEVPSAFNISKLHSDVESATKDSSQEEKLEEDLQGQQATTKEIPSTFDISKLHADVENATAVFLENESEKSNKEHQVPIDQVHSAFDISKLHSEQEQEQPEATLKENSDNEDKLKSGFDVSKLRSEIENASEDSHVEKSDAPEEISKTNYEQKDDSLLHPGKEKPETEKSQNKEKMQAGDETEIVGLEDLEKQIEIDTDEKEIKEKEQKIREGAKDIPASEIKDSTKNIQESIDLVKDDGTGIIKGDVFDKKEQPLLESAKFSDDNNKDAKKENIELHLPLQDKELKRDIHDKLKSPVIEDEHNKQAGGTDEIDNISKNAKTPLPSPEIESRNILADESSLNLYESAPTRPVTSDITPNIISNQNTQIPSDKLNKQVKNLDHNSQLTVKNYLSPDNKDLPLNLENNTEHENEEIILHDKDEKLKNDDEKDRPVSKASTISTDSAATVIFANISPRERNVFERSLSDASEKSEESKTITEIEQKGKNDDEAFFDMDELKKEIADEKEFKSESSPAILDSQANQDQIKNLKRVNDDVKITNKETKSDTSTERLTSAKSTKDVSNIKETTDVDSYIKDTLLKHLDEDDNEVDEKDEVKTPSALEKMEKLGDEEKKEILDISLAHSLEHSKESQINDKASKAKEDKQIKESCLQNENIAQQAKEHELSQNHEKSNINKSEEDQNGIEILDDKLSSLPSKDPDTEDSERIEKKKGKLDLNVDDDANQEEEKITPKENKSVSLSARSTSAGSHKKLDVKDGNKEENVDNEVKKSTESIVLDESSNNEKKTVNDEELEIKRSDLDEIDDGKNKGLDKTKENSSVITAAALIPLGIVASEINKATENDAKEKASASVRNSAKSEENKNKTAERKNLAGEHTMKTKTDTKDAQDSEMVVQSLAAQKLDSPKDTKAHEEKITTEPKESKISSDSEKLKSSGDKKDDKEDTRTTEESKGETVHDIKDNMSLQLKADEINSDGLGKSGLNQNDKKNDEMPLLEPESVQKSDKPKDTKSKEEVDIEALEGKTPYEPVLTDSEELKSSDKEKSVVSKSKEETDENVKQNVSLQSQNETNNIGEKDADKENTMETENNVEEKDEEHSKTTTQPLFAQELDRLEDTKAHKSDRSKSSDGKKDTTKQYDKETVQDNKESVFVRPKEDEITSTDKENLDKEDTKKDEDELSEKDDKNSKMVIQPLLTQVLANHENTKEHEPAEFDSPKSSDHKEVITKEIVRDNEENLSLQPKEDETNNEEQKKLDKKGTNQIKDKITETDEKISKIVMQPLLAQELENPEEVKAHEKKLSTETADNKIPSKSLSAGSEKSKNEDGKKEGKEGISKEAKEESDPNVKESMQPGELSQSTPIMQMSQINSTDLPKSPLDESKKSALTEVNTDNKHQTQNLSEIGSEVKLNEDLKEFVVKPIEDIHEQKMPHKTKQNEIHSDLGEIEEQKDGVLAAAPLLTDKSNKKVAEDIKDNRKNEEQIPLRSTNTEENLEESNKSEEIEHARVDIKPTAPSLHLLDENISKSAPDDRDALTLPIKNDSLTKLQDMELEKEEQIPKKYEAVSPTLHPVTNGAIPKVLGTVLDQQLAIATPKAEAKPKHDESASPEYIYIPLKDPAETSSISSEDHFSENQTNLSSDIPSTSFASISHLSDETPSTSFANLPHSEVDIHSSSADSKSNTESQNEVLVHKDAILGTQDLADTALDDSILSHKYDLVESSHSPRNYKDKKGTLPKALGTVLDQHLAITTPNAEDKKEKESEVAPEYIYIPLKDPSVDSSISSLQHSGEMHDSLPLPLIETEAKKETVAHSTAENKDKVDHTPETDKHILEQDDLRDPSFSPRVKKQHEGAIPKALGAVLDQQLAITAPLGKIKEEKKDEPKYIYIPLKDPNQTTLEEDDTNDKSKDQEKGAAHPNTTSKPVIKESLLKEQTDTPLMSEVKTTNDSKLPPPVIDHQQNQLPSIHINSKTPSPDSRSSNETPSLGLHLQFTPSPTNHADRHSIHISTSPEMEDLRKSVSPVSEDGENATTNREDRSIQSESPPIVIQSAQISESAMPLGVQLNQAPGQVFIIIQVLRS
ncbi:hypothetical protein ILUMI_07488 [Ignelater luminosus]|uniref:RIIa domain-containing protein n=1 Tax=Ignelater luminosus TaxID=2038154 RepID=A0A8K0D9A2_IGNLU|nr:hypothetical protein ILUMI_07488 [Ignelater luminosus]